jgi:hypothetical protein
MTRYTVVWRRSTQDELAEIWTIARDRNAVTAAAHFIDVELTHDAATKRVEVSEGLRAFFLHRCESSSPLTKATASSKSFVSDASDGSNLIDRPFVK